MNVKKEFPNESFISPERQGCSAFILLVFIRLKLNMSGWLTPHPRLEDNLYYNRYVLELSSASFSAVKMDEMHKNKTVINSSGLIVASKMYFNCSTCLLYCQVVSMIHAVRRAECCTLLTYIISLSAR